MVQIVTIKSSPHVSASRRYSRKVLKGIVFATIGIIIFMENVSPYVGNEEVLVLHHEINYLPFEVVCCIFKRDAKPAPDGIVETSVVLFNLFKRQQNTPF